MGEKMYHPTHHAIERFEERILPHLPDRYKNKIGVRNWIKNYLYKIQRILPLIEEVVDKIKIDVFLRMKGCPPIPVTLVINRVNRTIVTLYISKKWARCELGNTTYWRAKA